MKKKKRGEISSGKSVTNDNTRFGLADEYEPIAKYYDIWAEDLKEDIDFYIQLAETAGSPILVCMCGTGRILIPLAEKGYEVTGIDKSSAMLDRCSAKIELLREEVQGRIDILQADICDFNVPERFNFAIIPHNSFMHILETEDQEKALKNIWKHLTADGLLAISLANPKFERNNGIVHHTGTKTIPGGEIISRFESREYDASSQRLTIHLFYDISRQDRNLRRVTSAYTMRCMSYRETMELLRRCMFDVVEVYGDYAFSPFKKDCEIMVFLARKI
ncbi:MAG: class I SAM-dependent methyltransferase [Methanomassiliicoccales archaeon]